MIAVLVALLLPAVQRVREAAARAQSLNQLRQIALGTHSFADAGGRYAVVFENEYGLFRNLLPYLDGEAYYAEVQKAPGASSRAFKLYLSPADPTAQTYHPNNGNRGPNFPPADATRTSYPANARALAHPANWGVRPPDGSSQTIAFAEHYTLCDQTEYRFDITITLAIWGRRATFADIQRPDDRAIFGPVDDVLPVTRGSPPVTRPSVPGMTFQVRPRPDQCDYRVPQGMHPGGLLVALFDGSARQVRQGVNETVFWAAVTPNGGEVAPLD